jgi:hypothetical protein
MVTGDPRHPAFPAGLVSGRATPGQPNLARNATDDPDHDGIPTFVELAFNTDPNLPETVSPLPVAGKVNFAGADYATIAFRRLKGGSLLNGTYAAEGYTYTVEHSTDLTRWTPAADAVQAGAATSNPDNVTENVTWRLATPLTATDGRAYLRLRIGRQ